MLELVVRHQLFLVGGFPAEGADAVLLEDGSDGLPVEGVAALGDRHWVLHQLWISQRVPCEIGHTKVYSNSSSCFDRGCGLGPF